MPKKKSERSVKHLTRKKGDYFVGKAHDLADPHWQNKAREYRRKLSGGMRPLAAHDIQEIPKAKGLHVVRKYDGEFTYVVFDGESLFSINPGGTVRVGLPCFTETEKALK